MTASVGSIYVRRCAFVRATPTRVWREFTSFDRISAWLGSGHTLHALEPRLGGEFDGSVEIDGTRHHFRGTVLGVEAERELTLSSNWDGDLAWPVPTFWTFRLTPLYDGTLVELFHHGFERLGADVAAAIEGYEQGWTNRHLVALRAIVETD